MELRTFTPDFSASPQISAEDVTKLERRGFTSIINTRPDDEEPNQPDAKEIETAARVAGMNYHHIPVVPGGIGDDHVAGFAAALSESEGPVIAFCRTGTRAALLWALAEAHRRSTNEVIRIAANAGYDLTKYRGQIEAHAATPENGENGSRFSVAS